MTKEEQSRPIRNASTSRTIADLPPRPARRDLAHVGEHMPAEVGDIGFPIAVHPRDRDTVRVFPMDGTSVWPRTSPGGKPAVYRSRDGGRRWTRHDRGFPKHHGWLTVYRQAMAGERKETRISLGTYTGLAAARYSPTVRDVQRKISAPGPFAAAFAFLMCCGRIERERRNVTERYLKP